MASMGYTLYRYSRWEQIYNIVLYSENYLPWAFALILKFFVKIQHAEYALKRLGYIGCVWARLQVCKPIFFKFLLIRYFTID